MKIIVKVTPSAKEEKIGKVKENEFKISVKEPPIRGMANEAVIRVLAGYFNTPKSSIRIVSGYTSRNKIVEII